MVKRCLAVLLSAVLLAPSFALAQSRAGVVTTLEGNVTARRVALTTPVSLKFKDEVFLQDTVTTGDQSLARMLLGGKAVVTVRERSVLTITEVPGKSTIDLESGKFALAVAREKMRPGEEILIRTPNAIAGVRGTVVITEVHRQSAQLGGAVPAVLTNFYVLRGSVTAQPLDPGTRQPLGTPLQVGTLQAYSGAGSATPRVAPVPPEQVSQITSGLQPSGPKSGGDAGKEQIKAQAVQTAVALLGTLNGTPPTQTEFAVGPAAIGSQSNQDLDTTVVEPPVGSSVEDCLQAGTCPPAFTTTGPIKFATSFANGSTSPVVFLNNATVVQSGADPFIDVLDGVDVTLGGPLAVIKNSIVVTGGEFLRMRSGSSLTSVTPDALVQLTNSGIGGTAALRMTNATMKLAGALVSSTGLLDVNDDADGGLVPLFGLSHSTLTSTGLAPLISFSDSAAAAHVGTDNAFLQLVNGSAITLAGPLLHGSTSTFVSGTNTKGFSFISVFDGSSITSTSTSPLVTFNGATVDVNGGLITVRRSPSASERSRISLAGPLLAVSNSTVNTTSKGFLGQFGSASNCCTSIGIDQGGEIRSTTALPLVSVTNSTWTIADADSGANMFALGDTFTGAPAGELVSPSFMTLAGPLLAAANSTITPLFNFLDVRRSTLTNTTTSPLVTLSNVTMTIGGTELFGNQTAGRFVDVISSPSPFGSVNPPAFLQLAGPLMTASASNLTATQWIGVFGGGSLRSTTTDPLVTLTNTLFKLTTTTSPAFQARGDFAQVNGLGSTNGTTFALMDLSGPLLNVIGGSTLNMTGGFLRVLAGGQVQETHPSSPFVAINGGTHTVASDASQAMFTLIGRTGATTLEVVNTPELTSSTSNLTLGTDQPLQRTGSGALLEVANASVHASGGSGLFLDTALLSATAPLLNVKAGGSLTTAADGINLSAQAKLTALGPLVRIDGGTLTIGSGSGVTVGGGSFLNVTGDLVTMNGGILNILNGAVLKASGGSVVKIGGGLINFLNTAATVNLTNNLCAPSGCININGVNFFFTNAGNSSNVSVTNPFKNSGSATVNLSNGGNTAHVIVDGTNSKVIISGN